MTSIVERPQGSQFALLVWLMLGLAIAIALTGCGSAKSGAVDPCTGLDASNKDPTVVENQEPVIRQVFWLEHPEMSKAEACSAAQNLINDARRAQPAQTAEAVSSASLSDAEIDRLVTFGTMVGRAMACGENVESQRNNIADWLNTRVADREARSAYTQVVVTAVQTAALDQEAGRSPDTCAAVRSGFRGARLR